MGILKDNIQMVLVAFNFFFKRKRVSHNVPNSAAPAMTTNQDRISEARDRFAIECIGNNTASSSMPEVA